MANTRTSLSTAFLLSKEVGCVTFDEIVTASSGFTVIPIDTISELDAELMRTMSSLLDKLLKTLNNTRSRFQGNRVNEVGRRIEELLVNVLNMPPLSAKKLGSSGYPDIEISHSGRIIYLEMKTSSLNENSSFRYFYYTNGKKIKSDTRHLLLDFGVSEESPNYWKIEKCALSDLSSLGLHLKCEFNATKSDLLNKDARLLLIE